MITLEDLESMGYNWEAKKPPSLPNLSTPLTMVKDYALAANQPLNYPYEFDSQLERQKYKLIEEEFEEFATAIKATHALKELADLVYVCYGYAATFGWDLDEAIRRVHENNMKRMYQDDGSIKKEDGKVIKNPNYPKVDLGDLV